MPTRTLLVVPLWLLAMPAQGGGMEKDLIGHWPLTSDAADVSGAKRDGTATAVRFGKIEDRPCAIFDGRSSAIEIPGAAAIGLGTGDFALALWVHTARDVDDVLGDLVCQFDPAARRGFHLSLMSYAGVAMSQSNDRNVFFGIDAGKATPWTDCGRPGNALYVCALCVHDGHLFAGTYEGGPGEKGRVYRYSGGQEWIDAGAPDDANAVLSLAEWDGTLYAATGRYRAAGSALPDSPNPAPGGGVYRLGADGRWEDCGRLEGADTATALTVFRGRLHAIPLYHRGIFRLEGDRTWTNLGDPGRRTMALAPFNGKLFAAGNEGSKRGGVFWLASDGRWRPTGEQVGVDQVYSFAVLGGRLHAGTWPEAKVFRLEEPETWTSIGRLGNELEVMGMLVYNGKLYAGTLPLAEIYRHDGAENWTKVGRIDHTPDVRYRRAWSMAVYAGRLYGGTLPSGRVHAFQAGQCATVDRRLAPGWRRLVAQRRGGTLEVYVDGELAARSGAFPPGEYDLTVDRPLRIGVGEHDHFLGGLSDVRLYRRALSGPEIEALRDQAIQPQSPPKPRNP